VNQIPITQAFLGGLFGLMAARQRSLVRIVACALAALGAVLEGIASIAVIKGVHETIIAIPSGLLFVQYTFRLDPLSSYFNLAPAVVSLAVSIYSFKFTATAFSQPLRTIFAAFNQPRREIQTEFEVSAYYPTPVRFESGIEPAFETHLYSPRKERILARASRLRTIQAGSIHAYLTYIFITLIVLLLFGVRS
jgi:hypothetical protein